IVIAKKTGGEEKGELVEFSTQKKKAEEEGGRPIEEIKEELFSYIKKRDGSIEKESCLSQLDISEEQYETAIQKLIEEDRLEEKD
ncbi:hypothetical protein C9439_02060, partial [archaeon SCG-AAA382B04]